MGRPDPLPGNSNNDLFCDFYGGEEDGLQFGKEVITSSQVSSLLIFFWLYVFSPTFTPFAGIECVLQ